MSLVTGGVETKLGTTGEEDQLDQTLPHSRSRGKENKTLHKRLGSHIQEKAYWRTQPHILGQNWRQTNKVIKGYRQMEET